MILLILLSTFFTLAYLLLLLWMYPVLRAVSVSSEKKLSVSVIIPFRNEEKTLAHLLRSLNRQNYRGTWEVILINDHSEDDGVAMVEGYFSKQGFSNFRLIHLPKGKKGKKDAIALGRSCASGEVLVQTDADCSMNEDWLRLLMEGFSDESKLLIAPVAMLPQEGFWSRFAALEFLSLQATTAGCALRGRPIMGSAANMAYRKSLPDTLKTVGDDLSSGDDVFMIQALARNEPKGVKYILSQAVQTYTAAPATFSEFIIQRARWGSKTTSYTSPLAIATAMLVGGLSLLMVVLLVLVFFNIAYGVLFLLLFIVKGVADYIFLKKYAHLTEQAQLLSGYVAMAILYPFYIVITGVAMFFSISWKGRTIQK